MSFVFQNGASIETDIDADADPEQIEIFFPLQELKECLWNFQYWQIS